jgi:hypothetical protein
MTPPPNRIVQTSTEAKKAHKRNGAALPERQMRQLQRDAELEQRAQRIREADKRRREGAKKRQEQERKEREARKQTGKGLATQLIGYSHTQAGLKSAMEAFVGFKKKREEERKKDLEVAKQLEAIMEDEAKEPWDDDEDAFDLPKLDAGAGEQWLDDDLDDDTLHELHDLVTSDPPEEPNDTPLPPVPSLKSVPERRTSNEKSDFVRLHGPVNKALEAILDKLPEPLIQLLSQDTSTDPNRWDPASSLLHKLNPPSLPPHRLRVKVGCVVTLLRDPNSSSQLSKSQHLRLLRHEKGRLECVVLDGQLKGTKMVLTPVRFYAEHRGDANCKYQRVQYPIQVTKDWVPMDIGEESQRGSFRLPSVPRQVLQKPDAAKSPAQKTLPSPKPNTNVAPGFKLPGLPASKAKPLVAPKPPELPSYSLDGWDAFLDSGSQIARDLSSESSSPVKNTSTKALAPPTVPLSPRSEVFRKQDYELPFGNADDLDELTECSRLQTEMLSVMFPRKQQPENPTVSKTPPPRNIPRPAFNKHSRPHRTSPFPRTDHPVTSKHKNMAPPPAPRQPSHPKRKAPDVTPMSTSPQSTRAATVQLSCPVASHAQASRTVVAPKPGLEPLPSFSEFGLSTQEAVSFFDDDEDFGFGGSPPIAV